MNDAGAKTLHLGVKDYMTSTACKDLPTQEELHRLFDYNPDTGVLTWKKKRGCKAAGQAAGTRHTHGYRVIQVAGKRAYAHRLVWCYVTGEWPSLEIDHVNRVKDDNRILNLRESTRQQNQWNLPRRRDNTSGAVGVSWDASRSKWSARISVDGRTQHLGRFTDFIEAETAYRTAVETRRAPFSRLGVQS